jgi:hypothetical protein
MPDGPVPPEALYPTGGTRTGLIVLGLVLAAGAIAWLATVFIQFADFLSQDCKLFVCADATLNDHVRAYSEALIGGTGGVSAAAASYRAFRLTHAHGHMVTLRRSVMWALFLLVIWSVLAGSP